MYCCISQPAVLTYDTAYWPSTWAAPTLAIGQTSNSSGQCLAGFMFANDSTNGAKGTGSPKSLNELFKKDCVLWYINIIYFLFHRKFWFVLCWLEHLVKLLTWVRLVKLLEILANLQNLVDSVVDPVRPNKVKLYHERLLVAAAHLKYDNCVDFSNASYWITV